MSCRERYVQFENHGISSRNKKYLLLRGASLFGLFILVVYEIWKTGDIRGNILGQEDSEHWINSDAYNIPDDLLKDDIPEMTQSDVENAIIQRMRKQTLTRYCHRRDKKGIFPQGTNMTVGLRPEAFQHVIVDDKHQLLYCAIPKVACSNWKRIFLKLTGYADNVYDIPSSDVHNKSYGLFRKLSDYPPEEITFRLSTYYKFLFVRNPFERLTSSYRNKLVDSYRLTAFKEVFGSYILKHFRKNKTGIDISRGEGVTFPEFAKFIVESPKDNANFFNEHWERYDRLCYPCLIYYDFIGKFETLLEDAEYLLRILGISDKISFPHNLTSNYRVTTTALTSLLFSQTDSKTKERLYNVYKHDFEMFGYRKPT